MAELHDIFLDGIPIAEMEAGEDQYVTLDPDVLSRIKEVDEKPQFPVLKIKTGISANKFEWTPEIFTDIAEQINKNQPVGYLGHIKPEDDRYAFPPIQTQWLKAIVKREGDEATMFVKGYNLPDQPIRVYTKTGSVDSASWHGKATVQYMKGGIQRVVRFALESIDWSRKGKAAMSARLVTVASEMEGEEGNSVDGLSKVTYDELKAENPNLVELIKRDGAAEAETKIAEMEEKVEVADNATTLFEKLREVLKIDAKADILEAVASIQKALDDIGRKTVTDRVREILSSKIKDEDARNVVLRLMPVSEMSGDLDDEGMTKKVNEVIDTDENIKAIVNRFAGSPAPLKQQNVSEMGGNGDRYKSGNETQSIKVTRTRL